MRLSGSPTPLNKEASSWRVRSKQMFGDRQNPVTDTTSNVNFDAVLAQHFDRFCNIRRPGWNVTVQCRKH